jgi:hypothetical protein
MTEVEQLQLENANLKAALERAYESMSKTLEAVDDLPHQHAAIELEAAMLRIDEALRRE